MRRDGKKERTKTRRGRRREKERKYVEPPRGNGFHANDPRVLRPGARHTDQIDIVCRVYYRHLLVSSGRRPNTIINLLTFKLYKAFVEPIFSSITTPRRGCDPFILQEGLLSCNPHPVDYFLSTLQAVVDGSADLPLGTFHVCTKRERSVEG